MTQPPIDPTDPLFKPLTMAEVLAITGRKRRAVERWVAAGKLTAYEEKHRRRVVFSEEQVLEVEKEMSDAAEANRERIRSRGGRPGPRKPTGGAAT